VAADGFAKLAAIVVADVAGWRADHARDGVFLDVFAHVKAHDVLLTVEKGLGGRGTTPTAKYAKHAKGLPAKRTESMPSRKIKPCLFAQCIMHVGEKRLDLAGGEGLVHVRLIAPQPHPGKPGPLRDVGQRLQRALFTAGRAERPAQQSGPTPTRTLSSTPNSHQ